MFRPRVSVDFRPRLCPILLQPSALIRDEFDCAGPYAPLMPRSNRAGRVTTVHRKSKTLPTTIPKRRNGNSSSQTIGYSNNAISASGQQRMKRISQRRNLTTVVSFVGGVALPLYIRRRRWKVPRPRGCGDIASPPASNTASKRNERMAGQSRASPPTSLTQKFRLTRSRINCNYSPFVFNSSTHQTHAHPKSPGIITMESLTMNHFPYGGKLASDSRPAGHKKREILSDPRKYSH